MAEGSWELQGSVRDRASSPSPMIRTGVTLNVTHRSVAAELGKRGDLANVTLTQPMALLAWALRHPPVSTPAVLVLIPFAATGPTQESDIGLLAVRAVPR
jgi:hypothetical protein